MGRSPCCDELDVKKGPWSPEEDKKLVEYIQKNGHGSWRNFPKRAGLNRCGKSCRLRWTNYLRPDIKRGKFSEDEERMIVHLHSILGNKWSAIAGHLQGRTDNEIKNYWNTHLKRKLLLMGIDPVTHRRTEIDILARLPTLLAAAANAVGAGASNVLGDLMMSNPCRLQATDASIFVRSQMLQVLLQAMSSNHPANMNALGLMASHSLCSNQLNYQQLEENITNGSQIDPIANFICMTSTSTQHDFTNHMLLQEQVMMHARSDLGSPVRTVPAMDESVGIVHPSLSVCATIPTAQSTPPLVSASPDCMEDPSSSNASTPLEGLHGTNPGFLNDDHYWKDILDQLSWSSEL